MTLGADLLQGLVAGVAAQGCSAWDWFGPEPCELLL